MTHDELVSAIKKGIVMVGQRMASHEESANLYRRTVLAVVELHKPIQMRMPDGAIYCMGCGRDHEFDDYWIDYPCATIQAIEKELA